MVNAANETTLNIEFATPFRHLTDKLYSDGIETLVQNALSKEGPLVKTAGLATLLHSKDATSVNDLTRYLSQVFPNGLDPQVTEYIYDQFLGPDEIGSNPSDLWAKLQALPAYAQRQLGPRIIEAVAIQDPALAAQYWSRLPDTAKQGPALNGLLWQWGQMSATAGAEFVQKLPAEHLGQGVSAWVVARQKQDPAELLTWLRESNFPPEALKADVTVEFLQQAEQWR